MPRVYEDRSNFKKIFELCDGDRCSFEGTVASTVSETRPGRGLTVSRVLITDGTSSVTAIWFNQGYIKKIFKKGQRYIFYGKITANRGLNITGSRRLKLTGISGLEIHNPVYRLVKETHKTPADCEGPEHNSFLNILPVYPSISGLHQGILRSVIKDSLEIFFGHGGMDEIIPGWIRRKYGLEEINYSLKNVHFPENRDAFLKARYRLVFEELLLLQLRLYSIKNKLTDSAVKVRNLKNESEPLREFLKELPFELTPGQKRVLKEIETDMNSPKAMNRLVQGDVGSGKTVLAAAALYKNAKDGYQGVMMVPTGILAKQHYDFLKPLFNKHRINVELVTGDMHPRQKKKILEGISGGNVHVVVGTHALLEENVEFHNLNLVITDEQHRFGVRQRAVLNSKGETPDILVMSATPIPSVNAGIFLTPKTPVKI